MWSFFYDTKTDWDSFFRNPLEPDAKPISNDTTSLNHRMLRCSNSPLSMNDLSNDSYPLLKCGSHQTMTYLWAKKMWDTNWWGVQKDDQPAPSWCSNENLFMENRSLPINFYGLPIIVCAKKCPFGTMIVSELLNTLWDKQEHISCNEN